MKRGVCDTPLQNSNAGKLVVARRSAFLDMKRDVCDTPLYLPNAGRPIADQKIIFPQKVSTVAGWKSASPKRGSTIADQKSASLKGGSTIVDRKSAFLKGGTMKNPSRMPCRQPASPASVGAYRIRPTGPQPSDDRSPLSGRPRGVCDTPLQNPNAGRLAVTQRSASLNGGTMKNPSRMPCR